MSIYTREETYVHRILIIDRTDSIAYPSDCTFYLYDPCGELMNAGGTSMATSAGDSYFQCTYNIPADAQYGEYTIKVIATDADGDVAHFDDYLYIFPWNIIHDVRKYSGITSKKSVSDHDLSSLVYEAYVEALNEIYEYWHDDIPNCNPDTGEWFDGSNTVFETKHSPIADKDGDGVVQGWGEDSCGTDIWGWWRDSDGDCHKLKITVNDSHCGKITITQIDGSAIPNDNEWVRLNYYTEWESYDERKFRMAVAYLAAYKAIQAFKTLDKATIADLDSNRLDIEIAKDKSRMKKQYERAIRKVKKPLIEGGMIPGE